MIITKTKSVIKIILDIVMIILFPFMLFAFCTGLVFHELVGLVVVALFCLHLILNANWIKGVIKAISNKSLRGKALFRTILNLFIILGAITIGITGLMISGVVLNVQNLSLATIFIHKWTSYVTAGLISVHIIIHLKYMVLSIKRLFSKILTPTVRRAFAGSLAAIMITIILYSNIASAIDKKSTDTVSLDKNQTPDTTSEIYEKPEASLPNSSTPKPQSRPENTEQNSEVSRENSAETANEIETDEQAQAQKEEEIIATPTPELVEEQISLSDFLSRFFCNGCGKRCPLSSPRCQRSSGQIQQATEEYQQLYGIFE